MFHVPVANVSAAGATSTSAGSAGVTVTAPDGSVFSTTVYFATPPSSATLSAVVCAPPSVRSVSTVTPTSSSSSTVTATAGTRAGWAVCRPW